MNKCKHFDYYFHTKKYEKPSNKGLYNIRIVEIKLNFNTCNLSDYPNIWSLPERIEDKYSPVKIANLFLSK